MSRFIEFNAAVPVKPYLRKFVIYLENLEDHQALDLNSNTTVTNLLKILLTNKTNIKHEAPVGKNTYQEYSEQLKFKVGIRMQAFNQFFISRKSIAVFNSQLHALFHEILLRRILRETREGKIEKDIIYEFLREVDVEELVSFDAVKKANYRLRQAKKIEGFSQQNGKAA